MNSIVKTRSKNLIYFCVFYNRDYLKLLNLLLKSVKIFSNIDTIEFLIITCDEFKKYIDEISSKLDIHLYIQCFNFTTIFQAACARLYIFDYEYINSYEKILYLDTDIIIKGNLTPIFDFILDDVLYGLESGTINSPNFGKDFFDINSSTPSFNSSTPSFNSSTSSFNSSTTGINSGTLLFNNSKIIKDLFCRIQSHINTFVDSKLPIPYCMDQPFINYHAIKDNLYNNKLLNPLISLYDGDISVNNYDTSIICHFSFPIGNFKHKYYRMINFFNNITSIKDSFDFEELKF